ncbi:PRC-barrel domain-containing protein [Aestuariivita sp.]|uniref:PRC-barrel domain-containing protein n=1 Tax=Aestuariivita sp. TaxID=1872407 RepID=UPI002171C2C4|nr:PRC-barrel domain-containing protein [Aestuariivita sp.]MCE8008601.1 PRC-barrel domain containing protein [Aestuariivita sp.]
MKPLMMTTALTATMALAGMAQAQSSMDQPLFPRMGAETDLHASDFIGMNVYAAEPVEETTWDIDEVAGMQANWDNVGEINDLIITRDGEISAVLVDIGGFLGIGERQVAMNMGQIRFVSNSETEEAGDVFLVIPASMADLKDAPAYEGFDMAARSDSSSGSTYAQGAAADRDMHAKRLPDADLSQLTAEDLTGTRVYDAEGEWIGEVSQLNLSEDGTIDAAIVDVGGFLGLGEKPVELSLDKLDITRSEDDTLRVSVPMTKEELEALPTWNS